MFPKIQFIITTHSPLFLLGLDSILGKGNFEIKNMPNGEIIDTERFSEFNRAFEIMKDTEEFEKGIIEAISHKNKPIVYVEGITDINYIKKAYELYGKSTENFDIEIIGRREGNSVYNSNNAALKGAEKFLKCNLNILNQKIILLNDPEENREIAEYENLLYVREMPRFDEHILKNGIENLFEDEFIKNIKDDHLEWFSNTGTEDQNNKFRILNKSEVCGWICENGKKEDFKNFEGIFSIIDQITNNIEAQE